MATTNNFLRITTRRILINQVQCLSPCNIIIFLSAPTDKFVEIFARSNFKGHPLCARHTHTRFRFYVAQYGRKNDSITAHRIQGWPFTLLYAPLTATTTVTKSCTFPIIIIIVEKFFGDYGAYCLCTFSRAQETVLCVCRTQIVHAWSWIADWVVHVEGCFQWQCDPVIALQTTKKVFCKTIISLNMQN